MNVNHAPAFASGANVGDKSIPDTGYSAERITALRVPARLLGATAMGAKQASPALRPLVAGPRLSA
jgi:hypothetical protein